MKGGWLFITSPLSAFQDVLSVSCTANKVCFMSLSGLFHSHKHGEVLVTNASSQEHPNKTSVHKLPLGLKDEMIFVVSLLLIRPLSGVQQCSLYFLILIRSIFLSVFCAPLYKKGSQRVFPWKFFTEIKPFN